jgi:hypothetical protein
MTTTSLRTRERLRAGQECGRRMVALAEQQDRSTRHLSASHYEIVRDAVSV